MRLAFATCAALLLAACSGGSGGGGPSSAVVSGYLDAGCTDSTGSFLATYAGTFADAAMTTTMTMGASGSLSLQETRQVGGTVSGVPYPTDCTYVNQGEILGVFSAGASAQCQKRLGSDPGATDVLVYSVSQVTIPAPVSPACQTFADAVNQRAGGGGLTYSVPVRTIDANSFQFEDNGSGATAGETMVRK